MLKLHKPDKGLSRNFPLLEENFGDGLLTIAVREANILDVSRVIVLKEKHDTRDITIDEEKNLMAYGVGLFTPPKETESKPTFLTSASPVKNVITLQAIIGTVPPIMSPCVSKGGHGLLLPVKANVLITVLTTIFLLVRIAVRTNGRLIEVEAYVIVPLPVVPVTQAFPEEDFQPTIVTVTENFRTPVFG